MPGLSSLPRVIGSNVAEKTASFILVPVDLPDRKFNAARRRFQYFPATLTDTKAVNWANREIPGGTLPMYQWVSCGERLLSFTAYFTSDVDLSAGGSATGESSVLQTRIKSSGVEARNVDVKSALVWLRSFMFAEYLTTHSDTGTPLVRPPRTLILAVPNSGIGILGGYDSRIDEDTVLVIMTQCDITFEAFWPSGHPRIASVALAFAQTPQDPQAGVTRFPQAGTYMDDKWMFGDQEKFFGYSLKPSNR